MMENFRWSQCAACWTCSAWDCIIEHIILMEDDACKTLLRFYMRERRSMQIFQQMEREVKSPDMFRFVWVLNACWFMSTFKRADSLANHSEQLPVWYLCGQLPYAPKFKENWGLRRRGEFSGKRCQKNSHVAIELKWTTQCIHLRYLIKKILKCWKSGSNWSRW
jgi:hypothetical protein